MKKAGDIVYIPLSSLVAFKDHPFKVTNNEDFEKLKESIEKHDLITPITVRKKGFNKYEIISGHRRTEAFRQLGYDRIPAVIFHNYSDDDAVIAMVNANLSRETLLPSEKAFAYKMKMEAMNHQGKRNDLARGNDTSDQLGPKSSAEELATEDSPTQIKRYIRLTKLNQGILQLVDDKKIAFNVAVQLSFLSEESQKLLLFFILKNGIFPSLTQANELKKKNDEGSLTGDVICAILESKNADKTKTIKIKVSEIEKHFKDYVADDNVEQTVMQAIEYYAKHVLKRAAKNAEKKNSENIKNEEEGGHL